jgi:hypothetical protein
MDVTPVSISRRVYGVVSDLAVQPNKRNRRETSRNYGPLVATSWDVGVMARIVYSVRMD